jgi:UDP-4-amino-4,6-dideoxy-N-acetyl-beta-L-altrosamine transaminase
MKKKFIFYSQPYLHKSDLNCLKSVFRSSFLTQGPKIDEFEKKISDFVNSKYSTSFNSATSALHAACFSLGFKKNDILWTVPNTFVASANCSLYLGGNVDFVDVDKKTKNIDIDLLSKKLKESKKDKRPKIIVSVDFSGNPVLQDKIYNLSKKYKFKIIEDASHALGAKYKKYMVGSCRWCDVTIFSFHPVKTITTGEGGIATTNNGVIDRKLKMFRTHGITKNKLLFKNKLNKKKDWYYEQQFLGFNYRMTDIAAALGINQLKKINFIIKKRNEIAEVYKKNLLDLPIKLPEITPNSLSTFHLFTIQIIKKNANKLQLKLYKFLKKNGIVTNVHYLPVHLHPYYKKLGFKKNSFPISEIHAKTSLSLPIYPGLSIKEVTNVIKLIKLFFKNN